MTSWKRVIITTILGFLFGWVCYFGGRYQAGITFTCGMMWGSVLNRTILGFMIGISAVRINYLLHGIIIGAIATLPIAIPGWIEGGGFKGFFMLALFGIIYGILIELTTTKLFKAGLIVKTD